MKRDLIVAGVLASAMAVFVAVLVAGRSSTCRC